MHAFVVYIRNNNIYNIDCNIKIFKSKEQAEIYKNSIYDKYRNRSKNILDEYKNTNQIQDINDYNFKDLDQYISELIEDNVSENEIINKITDVEFKTIRVNQITLDFDNDVITHFCII